jgi:hypothetical protein
MARREKHVPGSAQYLGGTDCQLSFSKVQLLRSTEKRKQGGTGVTPTMAYSSRTYLQCFPSLSLVSSVLF